MARITKGMIAAAQSELECIHDLAQEAQQLFGTGSGTYHRHADSASRYLTIMHQAGVVLPEWSLKNEKHLIACGWRFPYRAA